MRQDFAVAVGANLIGAQLPDGSGPAAVAIDNHSGYWYQISPTGDWVSPYTTQLVIHLPTVAAVDLRAMPTGPAGQISIPAGDALGVTLYDDADAPPTASQGNSLAWLAPGQSPVRFLGRIQVSGNATFILTPSERSIIVVLPDDATNTYSASVTQSGGSVPVMSVSSHGTNALQAGATFIAPVSTERSLAWQVAIGCSGVPVNTFAFVFASTQLPITALDVGKGQAASWGSLPVVIAADQSAVPVAAVTSRGTTTYIAVASGASVATANDHLLSIQGGGSLFDLLDLSIAQSSNATAIGLGTYQLVRLSAVAALAGTAITANPPDPFDAAFSGNARSNPTTKGTEGVALLNFRHTLRAALTAGGDEPIGWPRSPQYARGQGRPIRWDGSVATNGIAVKNLTANAGAAVDVIAVFAVGS